MRSKSESRPDYIAEIDLPCDKLVDALTKNLKEENGLETRKIPNSTNQFLSKDPICSFRKAVIKAIPAQIEWFVENISPTKCCVRLSFSFPFQLRAFFYAIFVGLACFFSVAGWLIIKYGKHGFRGFSDPISLIILVSIIVAVGTIILFFITLFLSVELLGRYITLAKSLLQNICESHSTKPRVIWIKWILVKSKHLIDWKIPFFGVCVFCCLPMLLLTREEITNLFTSNYTWLLFVYLTVIVYYYIAAYKLEKRYSFIFKAVTIEPNVAFALSIGFLLLAIPIIMHSCAKDVIVMRILSNPEIERYLSTGWYTVNTIPPPAAFITKVHFRCLGLYFFLFFTAFFAIYYLIISIQNFLDFWSAWPAEHNKHLKKTFHDEAQNINVVDRISLGLPLRTKISILLFLIVFSASCWVGILINLSLLNALIAPDFRLMPFMYGEIIAKGTMLIACAMLGRLEENGSARVLHLLLVGPAILPFLSLVFLHFKALIASHLKTRSWAAIEDDAVAKINNIAAQMGVSNVMCLLDKQSNRLSPYAVIRGWYPKRMIVFTQRSLEFLGDHPEHAEAILAHEVAHLKHDCLKLWKLRLLSRLSLLGVGFLSTLYDSIAMEDKADNTARHYLRENGKEETLIEEAVSMLKFQNHLDEEFYGQEELIPVSFSPSYNTNSIRNTQIKQSLFKRIIATLRLAHDIYFYTDLYDYVHREARYRCTQPDIKNIFQ